jgi:hypothetical protein
MLVKHRVEFALLVLGLLSLCLGLAKASTLSVGVFRRLFSRGPLSETFQINNVTHRLCPIATQRFRKANDKMMHEAR